MSRTINWMLSQQNWYLWSTATKSKVGLNPKEENIAKILKSAGYKVE